MIRPVRCGGPIEPMRFSVGNVPTIRGSVCVFCGEFNGPVDPDGRCAVPDPESGYEDIDPDGEHECDLCCVPDCEMGPDAS